MNKDDINKLFDKLEPSQDIKNGIYNKILKEDNKKVSHYNIKNNKTRKNKFKIILVLSLVLIVSITAYAVSNIPENFSSKIKNFSISEDATNINISDSDKGYKIRAESIFGDKKFLYVLLSLEREDGKNLRNLYNIGSGEIWVHASDQSISKDNMEYLIGSMRTHSLDSGINTNKKEYFLHAYNTENGVGDEKSIIGGNLHLEFDRINLGLFVFGTRGDWELDIPLEYKDLSKVYQINKEFDYKGKKILLEKIHFSDLNSAIYFKSTDRALKEFSEEHLDIQFILKDGTIVPVLWDVGGGDNKGSHYYYAISLIESGRINPEDISEIQIGDIKLNLELK